MRDATHYRPAAPHVPDERGAERLLRATNHLGLPSFWAAPIPLEEALAAGTASKADAVHVEGNHGRWVVTCPNCRSAQLADPLDRRFMCHGCGNAAVDGLWRPVLWPKGHEAIAALLDERPAMADRNYQPGESLQQIREQNDLLAAAVVLTDPGPPQMQGEDYPEDHRHDWPKRVKAQEVYSCPGCGARYDGVAIQGERKATS